MALTKTPIELSSTPSIVDGGNATAITIDSSEFVEFANGASFGVSPHNEWESNYIGLEIGSSGFVYNRTAGNELFISANAYYDSGWKYAADGRAGLLDLQAGRVRARTSNASGSQDGAITWVTALDITADNGNVTFAGNAVTTSGYLQGGTRSETGGALVLRSNYSGDNYLSTQGTNHSSGGWYWGYGLQQDGSGSTTSTFSNFSGERSFVSLFGNRMQFNFAGASNTAIGSAITTSEKVRISNEGICFNGDSAAANALDDYEEGSWTPVIKDGSTTVTGSVDQATYTKIGRFVMVTAMVTRNDNGSYTNPMQITGLPYAVKSGDTNISGGVWFDGTGTDIVTNCYIPGGSSTAYPKKVGDNSDYGTTNNWQQGRPFYMSAMYHST